MRKISQMCVVQGGEDGGYVLAVTEDGSFWRGVVPAKLKDPVRWYVLNTPPEKMPAVPGKVKKPSVPSNVVVGRNVDPARFVNVQEFDEQGNETYPGGRTLPKGTR